MQDAEGRGCGIGRSSIHHIAGPPTDSASVWHPSPTPACASRPRIAPPSSAGCCRWPPPPPPPEPWLLPGRCPPQNGWGSAAPPPVAESQNKKVRGGGRRGDGSASVRCLPLRSSRLHKNNTSWQVVNEQARHAPVAGHTTAAPTPPRPPSLTCCSRTPMELALPKKTKPLRLTVVMRPPSMSSAACVETEREEEGGLGS